MISNKDKASSLSDIAVWKTFGYEYDLGANVKLTDFYTQNEFSVLLMESTVDSGYTRYLADLSSQSDSGLAVYENTDNGVVMQTKADSSIRAITVDDVKWSGNVPLNNDADVHIIFHDDDDRFIRIFTGTSREILVTSGTCVCLSYKAQCLSPYAVSIDSWGEIPDEGVCEEYVGTHDSSIRYIASNRKEIISPYNLIGDVSVVTGDPSIACDMILMMPGQHINFTITNTTVYNATTRNDSSMNVSLNNTEYIESGVYYKALNHKIVYIDKNDARPYVLPVVHVDDENYDGSTVTRVSNDRLDYGSLYHNTGMIMNHKDGIYTEYSTATQDQYRIDGILEYISGTDDCDGMIRPTRRHPEMRIMSVSEIEYCRVIVNVSVPSASLKSSMSISKADLNLYLSSSTGGTKHHVTNVTRSFIAGVQTFVHTFTYNLAWNSLTNISRINVSVRGYVNDSIRGMSYVCNKSATATITDKTCASYTMDIVLN